MLATGKYGAKPSPSWRRLYRLMLADLAISRKGRNVASWPFASLVAAQ